MSNKISTSKYSALNKASSHFQISYKDLAIWSSQILILNISQSDIFLMTTWYLIIISFFIKFNVILHDYVVIFSISDGDSMMHWTVTPSTNTESETDSSSGHHQARSVDVELTSYVLLCHLIGGSSSVVAQGLPIVKWLTQQRNGNGGFASTQVKYLCLVNCLHTGEILMFSELPPHRWNIYV